MSRRAAAGLLLAAAVAVAPSTPARAFFGGGGGGGSLFDDLGDMLGDLGFDLGDLFGETVEETLDEAAIRARREAGLLLAAEAVGIPAVMSVQLLQQVEATAQTDIQRKMLEAIEEDLTPEPVAGARRVREERGTHAVDWSKEGAEEQHYFAFVENAGTDVEVAEYLRGHLGEITSMQTAAGRELAQVLAETAESQEEDQETLEGMVTQAMAAEGLTGAVQALVQVVAFQATQNDRLLAVNTALAKTQLADMAGNQQERRNAMQQVAFDSRDTVNFGEFAPMGWPATEIPGLGNAGTVSGKHDPYLSDDPFRPGDGGGGGVGGPSPGEEPIPPGFPGS